MKTPVSIGLKAAQAQAAAVLRSPIFWFVLIALVFFLIKDDVKEWWAKTFIRTDRGETSMNNPTVNTPLGPTDNPANAKRNAELQALAEDIYNQVRGIAPWNDQRPYLFGVAASLHDVELRYVADYYQSIAGESLREAVEDEWLVQSSTQDELVAKLLKLNL